MIARTWHGRVPAAKAGAYFEFLKTSGIPDYKATPGNLGVTVLLRTEGSVAHFLLVSYWESMDVIHGFTGDDVDKAVYYPEDDDFLLEKEPNVYHYEVLE